MKAGMTAELERSLAYAINTHSVDNALNTPDFILAAYLMSCLEAWDEGLKLVREYDRQESEAKG